MRKYIEPLWRRWLEFRSRQAVLWLAVLSAIFFAISFAIHQPGVGALDLRFTRTIQQFDPVWANAVAIGFTTLGNTLTLILIAFALATYLFIRQRPLAATLTLFTLMGLPLNMIIKEVVGRPRPDGSLVSVLAPTIGLSYPSGHAMASTMLYGFLGLLCWIHIPQNDVRWRSAIAFAITALMVSMSRVYLGAHWLSDVVGGMTAGILCLLVLIEVYKHWGKKELEKHQPVQHEPELLHFEPGSFRRVRLGRPRASSQGHQSP